jgi:lysophospholipase L1-like esterase
MMQKAIFNRPATRFSCLSSLWVVFFILLAVAQSAHGQAVKIMPLGDSLTSGHRHFVSYRYDLWFDLIDAGFDVDFVGYLKNTADGPNLDRYPEYLTTFDRDHQGQWGYQTDELVSIAKSSSIKHQPDIVLLLAGVNDIWNLGAGGVSNARFGLRDIIEGIRSVFPGVTILLGQMNPYSGPNDEFLEPLNDAIAIVASDLDTTESPVILVDHYTGFDIRSMTNDGLHHNLVGEAWVAENWFEVLASIWPASEPFQINAGHSGAWFNPDTSGQGQFIDVEPETQFMFVSWFTYTDAASDHPFEQRWLTAQGNYSGNTAQLPLYETLGGRFDDPQGVTNTQIGEVTLNFTDCGQVQMTYSLDEEELQGEFPLNRVIPGSDNVC